MRTRIILVFIVSFCIGFLGTAAIAQKGEVGKVRQVVDKSVVDLTERIKASKDLKSVWKDISKVETEAIALRKKEKRQSETDEMHLGLLLSSLAEIPREKKFVKSECEAVKTKIYALYSPSTNEDGEYPEFIKLTEGVLKALCSK